MTMGTALSKTLLVPWKGLANLDGQPLDGDIVVSPKGYWLRGSPKRCDPGSEDTSKR